MSWVVCSWSRFIVGLVCGPLMALYLIPIVNCAAAPFTGSSSCWAGITGYTWYGLPVVGVVVLVVCPLVLISIKLGWVTAPKFVVAGSLVAAIIAVVLAFLDRSLDPIALVAGFVPLGCVAAFLFWLIAIRHNVNGG